MDFNADEYSAVMVKELIATIRSGDRIRPPKCVFLPCRKIVRKMVRALVLYNGKEPLK